MILTYELPHFSVSRFRSHAEYVDGCGGAPTVGATVGGSDVGVAVAVGAGVFVGAGVDVAVGVPSVGRGVGVPGVVVADGVPEGEGDADAEADALAEGGALGFGVTVRVVTGITVDGVICWVGLFAAALVEPLPSSSRVRKTASARNPRTPATAIARSATRRGIPGSPPDGGRSTRTPCVRGR